MNDLKEIIDLLNPKSIILGDNIKVSEEIEKRSKRIFDIRSASFFSFGQSKISNSNVVLIIDGKFISNIYSTLTEAWFQNTNIIVFAMYNSYYEINTKYLDRCTVCNKVFFLKDLNFIKENIKNDLKKDGPKVYNLIEECNINEAENDYSRVIDILINILNNNDELYVYNSKEINGKNINNIEFKYKYGVISKYVAYLLDSQVNKKILICNDDCFMLDTNILNNKYICEDFKLILVDNRNQKENIKGWCEENKLKFIEEKDIEEDLKKLYNSNEAIILLVKGGD